MRLRLVPLCVVAVLLWSGRVVESAEWQPTTVPEREAGAEGGVAFYRCFLRVPDNMTSRAAVDLWTDSAMLSLADVPGKFAIILNGRTIAGGESVPAEPRRRFKVPKGILERRAFNVLAIKLEGGAARAGLKSAPILHGYHDELVFEGVWERLAGEAPASDLGAVTNQPARAVFTEANFRESSTPLAVNADFVRGERLSPEEGFKTLRTPPGLAADLMLHEREVAQPTHLSFDGRGRLWVAQYRQYPYPAGLKMISRDKYYRSTFDRMPPPPPSHDPGRDIISVHEDTDSDGKFDTHRQVLTGLNMANAVLHGHGGIWVMHTPYLLFYPDANGDDVPDRAPEVRLAGFGLEDTHSTANGLVWGLDGWIYGAQGSTTTSHIRRPGLDAPEAPGVYYESCMVWRYHPETRAYEIFAEGGGNNFGLELDAEGRIYTGHNGGETRGWHFVQSGVYLKQGKDPGKFGPPTNPYAFGEMPMMGTTTKIVRFSHHFAVAEGTAIPADYLGRLFSAEPLHHQIVVSTREEAGSTFRTTDTGVALESTDVAFRPVFVANGPDGGIYVADFYERYIAHGQNYQGQIDPDSGRIYRIRGKELPLEKDVNLARKSPGELLQTLRQANKWHRQTAVRLLAERRDPAVRGPLQNLLLEPGTHPALEALWTLHQAGWLDDSTAQAALGHPAASVRAWVIRLAGDRKSLSPEFAALLGRLLATEPSAEVRCQAASTARRLRAAQAIPLVAALIARDADAADAFVPLLAWLTLEAFCDSDRSAVLGLFLGGDRALWGTKFGGEHIVPKLFRRFAAKGARADLVVCAQLLKAAPSDADRGRLVAAFEEAFKGRSVPTLPDELAQALQQAGKASPLLGLRQGQPEAIRKAVAIVADPAAPLEERLLYVRTFGETPQAEAVPALLEVARRDGPLDLRMAALASLSRSDDAATGREIADRYANLPKPLQSAAQSLLASRAVWSYDLLNLLEAKTLPPSALSAEAADRLRSHDDPQLQHRVASLLPVPTAVARAELQPKLDRIQQTLRAATGSPYGGEPIFMERCASCHQLFHKGGRIGPNLTPYQRDDLTTMLPSILDPGAEIREGFVNYLIETRDERSLSGFIADQDANVVVLRGLDGQDQTIERAAIAKMEAARTSLMPEGLLDDLSDQQLRDLFAYLRIPQPISR